MIGLKKKVLFNLDRMKINLSSLGVEAKSRHESFAASFPLLHKSLAIVMRTGLQIVL